MTLRLYPDLIESLIYVDSHYLTIAQREAAARLRSTDEGFRAWMDKFWVQKTTADVRERIAQTMVGTSMHVRNGIMRGDGVKLPAKHDATTTRKCDDGEEVFQIPALGFTTQVVGRKYQSPHVPRLEMRMWEGHGHFLFMEDPERFNREVEEFLVEHGLLTDGN